MRRRAKICIIGGGGNVGANCVLLTALKELGDVVAVDVPHAEGVVHGRMLDIAQAGPVARFAARIQPTPAYAAMAGSDIVVVTAGLARKPGMSRDDLVQTNVRIVRSVSEQVRQHAPDAILIIVSNPLDAMVYTAWKATGFPTRRILGQSGALDVARFKTFIARETGFSVEDVSALLLGGHGDDMVPLPRFTSISGIPVTQFISEARLAELVARTRKGGGEIVELMGTSAYLAPAAGVVQMVEAIVRDKKRIIPSAAYCDGPYGVHGLFLGVPAVLGAAGVERVIQVDLTPEEQTLMDESVAHVRELVGVVTRLFPDLA